MKMGNGVEATGGSNLAKVLLYYKLIYSIDSNIQKIVCPFHDDVNPSLIINLNEGTWFCFGCNLSGDASKFVKYMEAKYNHLNDLQSYKKYLQIIKSDEFTDIKIIRKSKKQTAELNRDLYNQAYDYYHGLSKIDWRNDKSEEVVEAKEYMLKRGFNSTTLMKCDARITYNKNYAIIFPMLDNGKFRGWVCRTMDKAIEKKRKYLYNEGFSRATTLVGNYGNKKYVFVVEGYMDRLKFIQNGVDNIVAILGWKMSDDQIRKLKEAGIEVVISALDNDECGKKGTRYLATKFDMLRFKYLKGIKDPGETDKENFNKMYSKTMQELYKKYNLR
jgi:DNA primase